MSKDLSISKSVIRKVYYEMYVLCSIGIKLKKKKVFLKWGIFTGCALKV